MNMYLHELKSMRKATLIWILAMVALAALFLSIYPGMADDAADFKKLLEGYPPAVRAMLGIDLDFVTSVLGFYSMAFSFIVLFGAIQAMNIGVSVLSKESRERTADFLLVKPVSRASIVSAKLLAGFTAILVTDVVFYAAASLIAGSVAGDDFNPKLFFMINLTMFFIQLIFLAVGMALSVFFITLRNMLPLSLGVVLGLYMIGAIAATGSGSDPARFISPFKYFDSTYIMKHSGYELPYLAAGAVITAVAIAVSYFVYTRKDIHAVS